ncbi:MAG: hypothetical protein ACREDS_04770 [Limisphaerales bacterium]
MNISKQEAQESLAEIESVIFQTRKKIAHSSASFSLILWGVIWVIGFLGVQFSPKVASWLWLALIFIGFIVTWVRMKKSAFQRPGGHRILLGWLILVGYLLLWSFLLHLNGRESIAFSSTLFMCGYVIIGLWLGRFWILLGLIVTALTVAGFYLLPAWFALWMAVTGGGSLILSGLFIRKFWR